VRHPAIIVIGALSTWIAERTILKNSLASPARSMTSLGTRVSYAFVDQESAYYGGSSIPFANVPPELSAIIIYNVANPHLNRMAASFVFHKFTVIAHGLPEFDAASTVAQLSVDQAG
jgi:hypothetical protein